MSTASHKHPFPLNSRPRDTPIRGEHPAPRTHSDSQTAAQRWTSGTPVMGPPNQPPGLPVMGATMSDLHLHVMGVPDAGVRMDPMGGPDDGLMVDVMGESDLSFVDCLFTSARY